MPSRAGELYPLVYPVLFATALVLGVAAPNVGQYQRSDLAAILAVVMLVTALAVGAVFMTVRALDRSSRAAPLAAALALLAVAWCFYYLPAQRAIAAVDRRVSRDRVLVPIGVGATVALGIWLLRQPRERLFRVSAFMTRFAVLLVGIVGAQLLFAQPREAEPVGGPGLARDLRLPLRVTSPPPPSRNTPPRDLYLVVLDGHANAQVLANMFGFDNSRFEDSLRAMGFLVPRDVRSNYVQTYLSVASLLNAAHVTRLAEDAGVTSKDHTLPRYLVKHNRVARFLKARGYRYVLFPSAWWASTANSPLADVQFDPHQGFELAHEVSRTELRLAVLRSTLLRFVLPAEPAPLPLVQHFVRSFAGLGELPANPAPTFAFAHILLPHVPYVVDQSCRPLEHPIPDDMEADTPEQRTAYLAQVKCVDSLTLALVTTLLRRSPTPPVILVVGDHGPRFSDIGFYGHPERVTPAFIRERFGAFGAFYLPAGGDSLFGKPVTLVNVLGNVLRYYFNAELPRSSDDMYVSGDQLYRFYRVGPDWSLETALPTGGAPEAPRGQPH